MIRARLIALCATLGLGCAQIPPPSEPAVVATTGVVAVAVELEMPNRYISFSGTRVAR